ncbi:MAG: iron-containing alcohol dehydrogenase [Candidatus Cloacimonadaceae bacterium]|nr:iron-containing alcohol dehydrogenase [Candidatus Cloacimonadaceae bacterium]
MFYLPTRIFFGADALEQSRDHIQPLGRKALIVTGKAGAKQCGALDETCALLDDLGSKWSHFDEITENPVLEQVISGKKRFLQEDCDFLIGIGGGSPIDAAKAISLAAANDLGIDDVYDVSRFKKAYPIIAIPTTSGTGTETTQYSVLTDNAKQKKAGFGSELVFPSLAICVPRYTLSLPQNVTLNTGIDALSHLLEGIYSVKRNPLLYPLIQSGVKSIILNLPIALNEPGNLKVREELMRASLYGGMTIAHAGTTLQHSIGYPLTSLFGVPHGLANGIVMKDMMELYFPAVETELNAMFAHLGMSKADFFAWLEKLLPDTYIPLTEEEIECCTTEVMASRNMASNPFVVDADQVKTLYRKTLRETL